MLTLQSNKFIQALAQELEVPEERYKQAEQSYKSFGEWTHREDSTISKHDPEVYVQGSFRLGTAIKPTNNQDEYDIDLVCVLNKLKKSELSQYELKNLLKNEVQSYRDAKAIKKPIKESRRCWTLEYADGAQFHMDILPALPNAEGQRILLEERGLEVSYTETAISITDNEHDHYKQVTEDWARSNSKGYCEWFKGRMVESFDRIRKQLAEAAMSEGTAANIEDIPEYRVRTPLQQAIMILKRHRDDMFDKDPENKPISIIITTLAAHAYNGENDVAEALVGILERMESHIKYDGELYIISNPTDATENFADRWQKHPERMEAFFSWLEQASFDFFSLAKITDYKMITESNTIHIAHDLRERAINRINQAAGVGLLGAATTAPAKAQSEYNFENEPRKPTAPRDFA